MKVLQRILKPFNGRTFKVYFAIVLALGSLLSANSVFHFFEEAPRVTVGDKNKDIVITIPRAPAEITAEIIACRGDVELVKEGGRVFYRAVFGAMGDDGIITNYSLVWTVNPDNGQPLSQYSVSWTHEDGITDDSDAPPEGLRIPADNRSAACLLEAS